MKKITAIPFTLALALSLTACDICGEKIGLLGNRKLEDGNLCNAYNGKFRCAGRSRDCAAGRSAELELSLLRRAEFRKVLRKLRFSEGMRKMGKAVVSVALLSAFGGLFGCRKTPEYTVNDIRSVSISCGHMDYSHSYSFYLRKSENNWLLDAEYAVDTEQPRIEYEERPVSEKDAKELLSIVQEQDVIGKLQRYKKPRINVQVADETSYYTAILLADGEQPGAPTHVSDKLVTGFYSLAGKYAGDPSETDDSE